MGEKRAIAYGTSIADRKYWVLKAKYKERSLSLQLGDLEEKVGKMEGWTF
jgi:hypothetical protein